MPGVLGGGGGGLGDLIGIAAPIAGGVIGGSFGGPGGAALGAGLGAQFAGGIGAGQAQFDAQQRQQQFLQQMLNARQNSALNQRLLSLLGVQGNTLDDLIARRNKLAQQLEGGDGGGEFTGGEGGVFGGGGGTFRGGGRNRARQQELDSLNEQIRGLEEAEEGFATTAGQITGARRRGVVAAGQAGGQALESALGQSGAGGGLAAGALAQQARQQQLGLADVQAGEFQLIDALRQQEITNLSAALGLTTPPPGFGAGALGQSLGVPQGNALTSLGQIGGVGTQLGLGQLLGLFGGAGGGGGIGANNFDTILANQPIA